MNLDEILNRMKTDNCLSCNCIEATYDENDESVVINGTFCKPSRESDMIQIVAISKASGELIWELECETQTTCSIPFTSTQPFICY